MLLCIQKEYFQSPIKIISSVSLTSWELQASVDSHSGSFTPPDVHHELQTACVRIEAIGEIETHFIGTPADGFRCVDQQLVQDILVGECGAQREDPAVLQRLRVELPSAEFAWGK